MGYLVAARKDVAFGERGRPPPPPMLNQCMTPMSPATKTKAGTIVAAITEALPQAAYPVTRVAAVALPRLSILTDGTLTRGQSSLSDGIQMASGLRTRVDLWEMTPNGGKSEVDLWLWMVFGSVVL